MKKGKVIKDLVHGYIEIDSREEKIINTLHFQRLKDIYQLTAQHVYPSATHNRFEHSLGVMHLSKIAFNYLSEILKEKYALDEYKLIAYQDNLIVATLLHDIGHAPLSHLGEKYYRKNEIKAHIEQLTKQKNLAIEPQILSKGSSHELMSCFIILDKYLELIPSAFGTSIDFELVCRCILGAKYNTTDKWVENLLIEILNSDTIDTDKLDYLTRDAYMSGVSVPDIDLPRLFRNIVINPYTKKITYSSNAIPVIQNIIDARDSLYLWVYNHHTTVYTDFIAEFYIKHLIANFENEKFIDRLDPEAYFSCNAISSFLISNAELFTKLKEPYRDFSKDDISNYTRQLFPQIFERKFLKPLWKTLYEYNQFLKDNIIDERLRDDLIAKMCSRDNSYRAYIVKQLIEVSGLNHGEVFIVPRSNKFYSLSLQNNFYVFLKDRDINIYDLLPQKNFQKMFDNVAFYIFVRQDKKDDIKNSFVQIALKGLPEEGDLEESLTKLKWFQ